MSEQRVFLAALLLIMLAPYISGHGGLHMKLRCRQALGLRGGGGGGGRRRPRRREGGGERLGGDKRSAMVMEMDKTNELFESYYKAQGIVPPSDFPAFIASLQRPLPLTFRIVGTKAFAARMVAALQSTHFSNMTRVVRGDAASPDGFDSGGAARPLNWFPELRAWSLDISRHEMRRNGAHAAFKRLLVPLTECGVVARQEAVSMIPPLLLGVRPGHAVLDMCASPGSKTRQLLEAIGAGEGGSVSGKVGEGFVIANDDDEKRCSTLQHHIRFSGTSHCLLSNHPAQRFPAIFGPDGVPIQYDRILCDVPCTGDGTLRKAPDLWRRWKPESAISIHPLQVQIAMRGLELLKAGGMMTYSTCSLNPVENEAVVYELLRRARGRVRLVELHGVASDEAAGAGPSEWDALGLKEAMEGVSSLVREPGLITWRVLCSSTALQGGGCEEHDHHSSCYPPRSGAAGGASGDEGAYLPDVGELRKCMRILPHGQDTGGFFIALFLKTDELDSDDAARRETDASAEGKQQSPGMPGQEGVASSSARNERRQKGRVGGPSGGQSRVIEVTPDDEVVMGLKETFGLGEDFPFGNLMTRDDEAKKSIYVVSDSVRAILKANGLFESSTEANVRSGTSEANVRSGHFRLVQTGLKLFERHSQGGGGGNKGRYRAAQEGMAVTLPFFGKRTMRLPAGKFDQLLTEKKFKSEEEEAVLPVRDGEGRRQYDVGTVVVSREGDADFAWDVKGAQGLACWRGPDGLVSLYVRDGTAMAASLVAGET